MSGNFLALMNLMSLIIKDAVNFKGFVLISPLIIPVNSNHHRNSYLDIFSVLSRFVYYQK